MCDFFGQPKMPPDSCSTSDSDLERPLPYVRRSSTEPGPKYICSIPGCEEAFIRLDHLDRHEFKHNGIRKHHCEYADCGKSYSILSHLKRHTRKTHLRPQAPVKDVACTVPNCTKLFASQFSMLRHVRTAHEDAKTFDCSHCEMKFKHKLKLRRHEIQMHTGEYPFGCDKCCKGFYNKYQLEQHQPTCKVYICSNCDMQFPKWTLYMKHCKEMQHGRTYYKCEHCERVYGKPGELQKHIADQHLDGDGERTFKCTYDECDRAYMYERNLRQHIRFAHEGKSFKCEKPDCGRSFSSTQNLNKHIERVHNRKNTEGEETGEPPAKRFKQPRKQRKDAGKPRLSHLSKLSGIAVDRQFDNMLRDRDEKSLDLAAKTLLEQMSSSEDSDAQSLRQVVGRQLDIAANKLPITPMEQETSDDSEAQVATVEPDKSHALTDPVAMESE